MKFWFHSNFKVVELNFWNLLIKTITHSLPVTEIFMSLMLPQLTFDTWQDWWAVQSSCLIVYRPNHQELANTLWFLNIHGPDVNSSDKSCLLQILPHSEDFLLVWFHPLLRILVSLLSHHWSRARNVQHSAAAAIGSCWSFLQSPDSSGSQSLAHGSGKCCRHCTPPSPPSPPPPLVRLWTKMYKIEHGQMY